ncbi:MAG: feruloyl-CoA synthase [Granulosicoccus sp.]
MKRTSSYEPHAVHRHIQDDGTILLEAEKAPGTYASSTGDWLHNWANESPQRVFLAERSGRGWREERYEAVLEQVRAIAATLLARGLDSSKPILIMSGNSVDHALLSLAAQYVGIPTVPLAEQYSLIPEAHGRLLQAIELVKPAMAYVSDAGQYHEALKLDAFKHIEIVASKQGDVKTTPFLELLKGNTSADVDSAHAKVTPDTVAKILMTSGSTSAPKGVLTTHKMMCANQSQIADSLPFLSQRPPLLMDWLPWNHVFGGSHNFNMVLSNGGSFYIDDGKPVKGLFDRTIENLGMVAGTVCFNVPVGFQMLLSALQSDDQLRQRFFIDLDMIFYAGASLPQETWEGFETMAMQVKGEVPLMTSSWGLTETAPAVLLQQEPTDRSGVVGVPLSGITVKLVPDADMRCEIRVKGPNVMPGYFEDPTKTKNAFDDEGYFITGDAMRFVDQDNPNKGLRFDGRISEDFKLLSGTWVRASQLRLDMLSRLSPLASDLVITGADRQEIGLFIFPNKMELERAGFDPIDSHGALIDEPLRVELLQRLKLHAQTNSSSSTRIMRAIVLSEPASIAKGEITAKGNLNFHQILNVRAELLTRLYNDSDPAVVSL